MINFSDLSGDKDTKIKHSNHYILSLNSLLQGWQKVVYRYIKPLHHPGGKLRKRTVQQGGLLDFRGKKPNTETKSIQQQEQGAQQEGTLEQTKKRPNQAIEPAQGHCLQESVDAPCYQVDRQDNQHKHQDEGHYRKVLRLKISRKPLGGQI